MNRHVYGIYIALQNWGEILQDSNQNKMCTLGFGMDLCGSRQTDKVNIDRKSANLIDHVCINPYMTNGLFHLSQLDESISKFRGSDTFSCKQTV